jgi:hypothetical protein
VELLDGEVELERRLHDLMELSERIKRIFCCFIEDNCCICSSFKRET